MKPTHRTFPNSNSFSIAVFILALSFVGLASSHQVQPDRTLHRNIAKGEIHKQLLDEYPELAFCDFPLMDMPLHIKKLRLFP